jgi:NAD dependent epimerase/dehydratase
MKLAGKKILVTGADGFIGSHLVEHLVKIGCEVRAMALYNSFGSRGWLDQCEEELIRKIEIVMGDVRDRGSVATAMSDCNVVFHLAALIGIPYSYQSPESYVSTNIVGTLNILEEARKIGCERTLVTSTSEVYGTAKYVPIDESHPFQAQSPYSATKIGADRLAESYVRSFECPVTVVRPFNTYGPRQSTRAVIPTIITQLCSGLSELQLGSLTPTRDLVYVSDTAQGFARIAESDKTIGEEINISTGVDISIGDLAQTIIELSGCSATIVSAEERLRPTGSEVERLLGSSEKLEKLVGWSPGTPLKEGLVATVDWFSKPTNLAMYRAGEYSV